MPLATSPSTRSPSSPPSNSLYAPRPQAVQPPSAPFDPSGSTNDDSDSIRRPSGADSPASARNAPDSSADSAVAPPTLSSASAAGADSSRDDTADATCPATVRPKRDSHAFTARNFSPVSRANCTGSSACHGAR